MDPAGSRYHDAVLYRNRGRVKEMEPMLVSRLFPLRSLICQVLRRLTLSSSMVLYSSSISDRNWHPISVRIRRSVKTHQEKTELILK